MQMDLKTKDLWSGKFTELKSKLEELEVQKCMHIAQQKWTALKEIPRVEALIFGAWNSFPECYSEVKKLAYGVLTIFGSTYSCEQAFSCMNIIKTMNSSNNFKIDSSQIFFVNSSQNCFTFGPSTFTGSSPRTDGNSGTPNSSTESTRSDEDQTPQSQENSKATGTSTDSSPSDAECGASEVTYPSSETSQKTYETFSSHTTEDESVEHMDWTPTK
ncbi:hypothetical protein AVEN_250404-1 [Araneus ventricosus]|uniref:HAT C-terminal dimerisation domain-containing protein n=1 Tax=Araneus ventricosus TaxID=182803 RepID=A0A4Y2R865_ARAVE|nr:hypothetical protein AVEN_250404-1 [Araneus ventricosus]